MNPIDEARYKEKWGNNAKKMSPEELRAACLQFAYETEPHVFSTGRAAWKVTGVSAMSSNSTAYQRVYRMLKKLADQGHLGHLTTPNNDAVWWLKRRVKINPQNDSV